MVAFLIACIAVFLFSSVANLAFISDKDEDFKWGAILGLVLYMSMLVWAIVSLILVV